MVSLSSILATEAARLEPSREDLVAIKNAVKICLTTLRTELRAKRVKAEPFVGGSFAKDTLLKKDTYEADIFVRFEPGIEGLSDMLEKCIKKMCTKLHWSYERAHGSRDYFKVTPGRSDVVLEIVPVMRIRAPREEKNITDLSYFHVGYVKKHLKHYKRDVLLAKQLCRAHHIYGAESYIHGFSGYGLECLIIYYKGFVPLLKAMTRVNEQLIIDPAHYYKNIREAAIILNESKRQGPIVLIDPTYKERNVLAALSQESFKVFQNVAKRLLTSPSPRLFEIKSFDSGSLRNLAEKKKAQYLSIVLETDRPRGDIAGTKLKKASHYLVHVLESRYSVLTHAFEYHDTQEARFHLVVRPKEEIVLTGPPITMKEHAQRFKKEHAKTFVKRGRLYAYDTHVLRVEQFLERKEVRDVLAQMGTHRMTIEA